MAKKDPTPTTRNVANDKNPPAEEEPDSVADGAAIGAVIGTLYGQPVAGAMIGAAVDEAADNFFGRLPKQEGAATGASPASWTVTKGKDDTVDKVFRGEGTARDAVKDLPILGENIDKALDAAAKGTETYERRLREAAEADPFVGSGPATPPTSTTPTAPGNFLPSVTEDELKAARDKYLGKGSGGSAATDDTTFNSILDAAGNATGRAGTRSGFDDPGSGSSDGDNDDASGGAGNDAGADARDPFADDGADEPAGQSGGTADGSDSGATTGTADDPASDDGDGGGGGGGDGGGVTGEVDSTGPSTGYEDENGNRADRDDDGNWTDETGEPLPPEEAEAWEAQYQAAQKPSDDDDDDDDEDDDSGGGGASVSFTPDDENDDVPFEDPLGTLPTKTLKGQDDGHTDPPDDDAQSAPLSGLTEAEVHQEKLDMFGQPPGDYGAGAGAAGRPEPGTDFTSPTRGGATDPTPDADDPMQTGPTDDPFAGTRSFEPMPPGDEAAAAEDTDGAFALQQSLRDATVADDDIDLDRVYDTPTHKMVHYE